MFIIIKNWSANINNFDNIHNKFFSKENFSKINLPVSDNYKMRKFNFDLDEQKHKKFKEYQCYKQNCKLIKTTYIKQKSRKINKNLDAIINNINKLIKIRGDIIASRR